MKSVTNFLRKLFASDAPVTLRQYPVYLLALIAIFGLITYLAFLSVDLLAYLFPGFDETRWNIGIDIFFTIGGFFYTGLLTLRLIKR